MVRYVCNNEERRAAVEKSALNGIDYLEVVDGGREEDDLLRQHFLAVRLFKDIPADLKTGSVRIEGGVRITPVKSQWALPWEAVLAAPDAEVPLAEKTFLKEQLGDTPGLPKRLLIVRTDSNGDHSTYRLRLVKSPSELVHPVGFDPRLSEVDFSFKVECPSDFDCKPVSRCAPEPGDEPEISYLAKDYASFRRLMLDRLSAITPGWRERSPADVGVVLVEILAYVGDQLSYFQDAVATEAYLGTARKRISVRRHARLVDYFLHEGVNARTWVAFKVGAVAEGKTLPVKTPVLTRWSPEGAVVPLEQLAKAVDDGATVFETLDAVTLHGSLNEIDFYTWSDRECCLPVGATAATLVGPRPDLEPGLLLLFEEVLGPETGAPADADPRHRHVVRLTQVKHGQDPLNNQDVVEIEWSPEDALPFPLCISAVTDDEHGAKPIEGVSVARGNVAPADHGYTVKDEDLGETPEDRPFRPALRLGPLTNAAALPNDFGVQAASTLTAYRPDEAQPAIHLTAGEEHWSPRRDLLSSGKFDQGFVAEGEEDGRTHLRFGDDENGKAPAVGTAFKATYRAGNGRAGNLGAEALCHVVIDEKLLALDPTAVDQEKERAERAEKLRQGIQMLRNPLPAAGGVDPESLEEARQYAPQAFRFQQRAVTEADYAEVAQRHKEVQRAAATFRWTGSWYTVFLTVDRVGGRKVDADFEIHLRDHMERFRMAGYDLEVDGPRFVPLDLILQVCVKPDYFRSQVQGALLDRLSNRVLPDGRRGFFHPDEWTFGQPVHLSRIYAAASEVEGVESVKVERFQRLGRLAQKEIQEGILPIGRLEIAVLDNDPNFQENGSLKLSMGGGK